MYVEYCKQQQPSIYGKEIQRKLVENNVCLAQNLPSNSSITRSLREDLGYSYKLNVVAKESLNDAIEARLIEYLTVCSTLDAQTIHFFDECSVTKQSGNRKYGHSPIGQPALEIQRNASNVNYTVNLLHSIFGTSHVNILNGPSNGLELLNFFQEALEQEDIFGNPILKHGDTIIMDNCGFHHGGHVEPVLRNMLAQRGCNLVFQPPYHPVYNTCEYCFRVLKGWLRKNTQLTEDHTHVAIYDGISRITPEMSRNFFRHCGYIL
jgi:transposase